MNITPEYKNIAASSNYRTQAQQQIHSDTIKVSDKKYESTSEQ